ncbi:hypothetical protein AB3S75_044629 [Citrus x aurantiifolia]
MDKANGITDRFEERAVSIGHYADLDGISDQLPSSSGGRQVDIHFDGGVDGLRPLRSGSVRKVFEIMAPDSFTLSSVLPIFADYVDVIKGKEIHGYAIRHGLETNVCIGNAISWNSIIAGYVQNGLFDEGLKFFGQMLMAKIKARHVPFSRIMHAGSTENVWLTLLSACRVHRNVELAEKVADMILMIDPNNTGAYVILSAARIWKDAASMYYTYAFVAGDESHPYYHSINEALKDLLEQEGYVPDTKEVLLDVEEEQKKNILYYHGERLALVFGIISTPDGTTIRVIKNLRVLRGLRHGNKVVSKIVHREMIVRDNRRFCRHFLLFRAC